MDWVKYIATAEITNTSRRLTRCETIVSEDLVAPISTLEAVWSSETLVSYTTSPI